MNRLWSVLTAAMLCVSLAACSGGINQSAAGDLQNNGSPPAVSEDASGGASQPHPAQTAEEKTPSDTGAISTSNDPASSGERKILIAYFTWADNTVVADPASVDVDAITSASVLVPGNTARMAGWIAQEVGGDLFPIITVEPYSSDYDECLDRAADEKAANARPALTARVENMDKYDVVFLGFPNWWYTVPMAIHTFTRSLGGWPDWNTDRGGETHEDFCHHRQSPQTRHLRSAGFPVHRGRGGGRTHGGAV